MPATASDVRIAGAFATFRAISEACLYAKGGKRLMAEQGLLQLLNDCDEWIDECDQFSFADESALSPTLPEHNHPGQVLERFVKNASLAQKEVLVDSVIPIYIEGLRRGVRKCPALILAKGEHAERVLVSEGVYALGKTQGGVGKRTATQTMQLAARRAALLGGALRAAQERAATRTYVPGGAGARDAALSFASAQGRERAAKRMRT